MGAVPTVCLLERHGASPVSRVLRGFRCDAHRQGYASRTRGASLVAVASAPVTPSSDRRLDLDSLCDEDLRVPPLVVTRAEAARLLSLSVPEIDRLRRAGRLLAKRHGTRVLFPIIELERFVETLPWEPDLPS